jgi:hypothetical protein
MELSEPIDPAVAAAGDAFTARLREALKDARGRTVAPRGSKVEGRLLRVQQHFGASAETIVVLRPESVEVRGARVALAAMQDFRKIPKKTQILLPFAWETDAALFRFAGEGAVVPKGAVTNWRTMAR